MVNRSDTVAGIAAAESNGIHEAEIVTWSACQRSLVHVVGLRSLTGNACAFCQMKICVLLDVFAFLSPVPRARSRLLAHRVRTVRRPRFLSPSASILLEKPSIKKLHHSNPLPCINSPINAHVSPMPAM